MSLTFPVLLPLILGVALFLLSLFMLIKGGMFRVVLRALPAMIFLALSIILIFGGFDLMSYRQLLKEATVATVHFEENSPQTFTALLITEDQQKHYFQLKGDQWQMDARIIRWHPNLVRMGFETIYRMERISGRYNSIQQELNEERTVYPVVLNNYLSRSFSQFSVDMWAQMKQQSWLQQWVDATYGSATYMPMVDGAVYEVKAGYSGLSAHPVNTVSRQAVKGWQ